MIIPLLCYRDADRAITFIRDAFGFEEREMHRSEDGGIVHSEFVLDDGMVMLGSASEGKISWPPGSACTYVVLDGGIDEACERARAAGAEIVLEPTDQPYGSRDFVARDFEGNLWCFGTYRPTL